MNRWLSARAKAHQVRQKMEKRLGIELYGEDLIAAIVADQELICLEVAASNSLLGDRKGNCQARYYTEEQYIVVQEDLPSAVRTLLKGHEIGHHFLHTRQAIYSIDDIDPAELVLTLPYAEGRIATYNSRQMQEHEATVFACELLMPAERLAARFDAGDTVEDLAILFGVSEAILFAQMATALLVPLPNYEKLLGQTDPPPFHWSDLDDSQKEACCAPTGPVLVQAGPGTGKTRTLTSRVEWLITEQDAPPEQILALTFTNKATDELRLRLRGAVPAFAHQVMVTTFHGFGLELLRRYAAKVGLPSDFTVLDPLEAEMVLEAHLAELDLSHFSDPTRPDRFLDEIVKSISKAKEELLDVATCEQQLAGLLARDPVSATPESIEQYRELIHIYKKYEEILHQAGFVDYGDLVLMPVLLLRNAPEVTQQLRQQYQHVLVDEYQDINRANGELVRLLAGDDGDGLWAVGDLRQSIYRWRGATPEYLVTFQQRYPHAAEHFLGMNYRSSEKIVGLISHFAPQMNLPAPARHWTADRGAVPNSSVLAIVVEDKQTELSAMAETIQSSVQRGAKYADAAILCRTNPQAREIAAALSAFGIPTLHLGRFFFRPEVKDLLSVLALTVDGHSATWIRVASLLREPLSVEDAADLWRHTNMVDTSFPDALRSALEDPNLSPIQRSDLAHMAILVERHLFKGGVNPWRVLCEFLFGYGHYVRQIRTGSRSDKQQVLLAIAQLLNLANAFRRRKPIGPENQPIRIFLNYVRRATKRDNNDIDLPISEPDVDAVRILTIHKAKGLEFPIVFVPNLAKSRFPARMNAPRTVPRLDQLASRAEHDEKELEEESCLFVALSRARDYLVFSRAASYYQQRGKPKTAYPSMLWRLLTPALRAIGVSEQHKPRSSSANGSYGDIEEEAESAEPAQDGMFHLDYRSLRVYQRCPRKYYYRHRLGLAIRDERDIYQQFHHLVYQTMDWLRTQRTNGENLDWQAVVGYIDQQFQENLPPDHVHVAWYRQQAERLVKTFWTRSAEQSQLSARRQYQVSARVEVEGAIIQCPIDEIADSEEQTTVTLFRTGRLAKSHLEHPLPALSRRYAQSYADLPVQVRIHYLATDEIQIVPADKDGKILRAISEDMSRIRQGHFPPKPSDNRIGLICGGCSYFHLCPGGASE